MIYTLQYTCYSQIPICWWSTCFGFFAWPVDAAQVVQHPPAAEAHPDHHWYQGPRETGPWREWLGGETACDWDSHPLTPALLADWDDHPSTPAILVWRAGTGFDRHLFAEFPLWVVLLFGLSVCNNIDGRRTMTRTMVVTMMMMMLIMMMTMTTMMIIMMMMIMMMMMLLMMTMMKMMIFQNYFHNRTETTKQGRGCS